MLIIEPKAFDGAVGCRVEFCSGKPFAISTDVVRKLHYQVPQPYGKLVRLVKGAILEDVLEIRLNSPTFRRWVRLELREEN